MYTIIEKFKDFKVKACFNLMLKLASMIGLNVVYCWTGGEGSGRITVCLSTCNYSHSKAVEEMYENSLRM